MKAQNQHNVSENGLHCPLQITRELRNSVAIFQFTVSSPEESNFERRGTGAGNRFGGSINERNMASVQTFFLSVFIVAALNIPLLRAALPGMLFPKDSERREVKDLSGMWDFRADMSVNRNGGFENMWFAKPLWQVRLEIQR